MMLHHHLAVFIKVAEYQSITLAAKELYISQPAVSNVIRRLEDELKVQLFYRDRKQGLLLTDVGRRIFNMAKEMEDLDNRIYQTAYQERHLIGGRLRVASVPFLTSAIIGPALHMFYTVHPDVDVELIEGMPGYVAEAVENHHVDFALSCTPYDAFDHETLISDCFVAIFPYGTEVPDMMDLRRISTRLIINCPAYETMLAHSEYVPDRKHIILVQQPESAITMVAAGVGAGIISQYTVNTLAPQLPACPIAPPVFMDIGIFAISLKSITPAAEAFIRCIKEHVLHRREK